MFKSFVIVLTLLGAAGCTGSSRVEGSGVSASQERQVAAFEAIESAGSFAVEAEIGPVRSVRVEGDDNVVPLITTVVEGTTLKISSRASFGTSRPIKVIVSTPNLVRVDLSGSGSVQARAIAAQEFAVHLSGSGAVKLVGHADALTASVDGSGSLAAAELTTTRATVELSGSGGAEVHASAQVVATVSGSGSVRYTGGATDIVREVSGSGKVVAL